MFVSGEYCPLEVFEASCRADEVILIEHARFGVMRVGGCIKSDLGQVGCGADVTYILDDVCSGRRECALRVGERNMKERSSCVDGLEQYLVANYSCRKGNLAIF